MVLVPFQQIAARGWHGPNTMPTACCGKPWILSCPVLAEPVCSSYAGSPPCVSLQHACSRMQTQSAHLGLLGLADHLVPGATQRLAQLLARGAKQRLLHTQE